jgi:hypothetical protein
MKYIVIGGVAGGATAAARIRRNTEQAEIILFEKGEYISYANCGLPYYIGGVIAEREKLFVQTPEAFGKRFNIDVRTRSEVIAIHSVDKTVDIRTSDGKTYTESYDKLLLSPGASPVRPPLPGIDNEGIFTLRNVNDTDAIKSYLQQHKVKRAVIIGLDLFFILQLDWGIKGAAIATVAAQGVSALGIMGYAYVKYPELRLHRNDLHFDRHCLKEITSFSALTCVQQSVMNLGILMVQGLVNSFGTVVMAAFAAAIKIDSFAYMPVQEFGNAFSTFIAQNFGARKEERIRKGVKSALITTVLFSLVISILVFLFAKPLMLIFVRPHETEILNIGISYLRIEGAFYCGIGILFLLYGYYRAIRMPGMSVVLTVVSLGTRVALSYWLAGIPAIGVIGIWWSIPIGWFIADVIGIIYYKQLKKETAKEVPAP